MAISEIEKLERRYAENPQGLTFAPLAEIHRKNGDVAKALELLGPGLTVHPDYIPASIVLGRCHLDLGDQHAAEAAFTHVLSLDGENVIALKALAEITERLLRLDESERWLHTLLSVDRSNDDAREQLERVQASHRQAETASSAAPDAGLAAEASAESTGEAPVEALETHPFEEDLAVAPMSPPPPPLADLPSEPGMAWVSESYAPSSEEAVPLAFEDLEPEDPPTHVEQVEPLMGLVGREEEDAVVESLPDLEPFGGPASDEFRVETAEDIILQSSGASEFQMPDAAEELFGSPVAPPPPSPPPVAFEPEPVAETVPEPVAQTAAAPEAIAEPASLPEPVVTKRQYAASDTGGRSAREFFRSMLASRPPAAAPGASVRPEGTKGGSAPEPGGGAPTRPALDSLSLSSVFGEEGTPTRPAVPAAGPSSSGGVSFDEFFDSPAQGGSPRPPRSPDPKSDDLDQFHTWLQNLKR